MAFFLALEGADHTGKSTVHSRVVDRLAGDTDRPVAPSKEPGSVDFEPGEGWSLRKPTANIEPHLNTTVRILGLAASMCESELASSACLAAAFVAKHEAYVPPVHRALMPGESGLDDADAWAGELVEITDEWENFLGAFEMSPALKDRFAHYTARDAIRHAILHASDSSDVPPTATGLMFFADHVLHGEMVDQLPEDAVVISDRTHFSQRAYTEVRGDDRRVLRLYDAHQPIEVDEVAVLTAPDYEIARRAGESQEETEADWDVASNAKQLQKAYRQLGESRDFTFINTHVNSAEETADKVLSLVTHN